uniref:CNNM transmembrane domain-containing protein n=1 Tax=Fagus sylvatica TaxID=28930 RepID=A0A2N9IN24_FAGSY
MRKDDEPCCQPIFWIFLAICLVLLSFAGITSGLALGFLSFNQVDLEVIIKAGQPQAQKNAAKIMAIVKNKHLLLCTLLIGKSLALEALPIFMDTIMPPWAAILLSATLVLAFLEIIPQAVSSRYALSLGAKLAAFVSLLLFVFFPISYPIRHRSLLRRAELKTVVDLHANEAGRGGELLRHETSIITGALDLTEKTAKDAMAPIS